MNTLQGRLEDCFALALPGVHREQARSASMETVAAWDSLATINILALVEEEFRIKVPDEDLVNFKSFGLIAAYLGKRADASGTQPS
ncbi:MAG TPA: acyl carrier protein [Opitutaceae bacterium]|jgi:acyl carrier protein